MSASPPAFQFYPDDFLGGVSDMTQGEVGAYILLLCTQWNRGSIPVQPDRQRLLAKGDVSDHVLAKFREDADGLLRNERLEKERHKQAQYRDSQRVKGQKSGASRRTPVEPRLNPGSYPVGTGGQPEGNSPSPSPSPSPISTESTVTGVQELLAILGGTLYGRPMNQWPTDPEQRSALEVVRRPNWKSEVESVLAFGRKLRPEDRRFQMPHTLSRLLSDWSETLDKARSYNPTPVMPPSGVRKRPPQPHVDCYFSKEEWRWIDIP